MEKINSDVFCVIDDSFCSMMKQYARGRLFIDCGAGAGMFGSMMPLNSVLSIDMHPEFRQEELSPIIKMDITEFSFTENMVPIFIRPCHNNFVHETIMSAMDDVESFLYVSMPHNVSVDLDGDEYDVSEVFDEWTGSDGEKIYEVKKKGLAMKKSRFILVQTRLCRGGRLSIRWYKRGEGHREGWKLGTGGGGSPMDEDDKVLQEVEAECFDDLDFTLTNMRDDDLDSGWLSRDGTFYGCGTQDHDYFAWLYLKKEVSELEKEGWVRVYGAPRKGSDSNFGIAGYGFASRLSGEQRNWLSINGHLVDDFD